MVESFERSPASCLQKRPPDEVASNFGGYASHCSIQLQKAYTPKAYLTLTVSNALNWQKQRHGQAMLAVYLLNEIIKGFPFSKARDSCPFLSRFC